MTFSLFGVNSSRTVPEPTDSITSADCDQDFGANVSPAAMCKLTSLELANVDRLDEQPSVKSKNSDFVCKA